MHHFRHLWVQYYSIMKQKRWKTCELARLYWWEDVVNEVDHISSFAAKLPVLFLPILFAYLRKDHLIFMWWRFMVLFKTTNYKSLLDLKDSNYYIITFLKKKMLWSIWNDIQLFVSFVSRFLKWKEWRRKRIRFFQKRRWGGTSSRDRNFHH